MATGKFRGVMILEPIFVDVLPPFERIKNGQIWISHKHRTINLRCPCGCLSLTVLTLHPDRWHLCFDGRTVSLVGHTGGSVWTSSGCRSHYYIRENKVIWFVSGKSGYGRVSMETERELMIPIRSRNNRTWLKYFCNLCRAVVGSIKFEMWGASKR